MADRVETIGIYSAYGFAKEAGYTGTKAEFEQGLKNSAEYADNAASSANAATNAKNAAVTAKTDAQAAQSAAETAQGLAEDAQAAAEEAKNDAEAAAASLDASTIARIDGFYENMGVGTADQLMASQKVNDSDPYIFRTSGGTSDIGNREELEIVGGSIVWNQLQQYGANRTNNGVTYAYENGILSISGATNGSNSYWRGNGSGVSKTAVLLGHVYLLNPNCNKEYTGIDNSTVGRMYLGGSTSAMEYTSGFNGCKMYKATADSEVYIEARFIAGEEPVAEGLTYKPVFFDLTAMFGSTIADHIYELEQAEAGAGVTWFRKYFPDDYYDYNPGELMHVSDLQSHDTVGFNLWDEEWEVGSFTTTGATDSTTDRIRSKNYIPVFPNTTYYGYANTSNIRVIYYNENKIVIGYKDYGVPASNPRKFKTPENCHYIKFNTTGTYGKTYKNDICINLSWSGTRDGEYEPYVKHSYPLDSSLTLRGISKLTADGDLTYDGDIYKPDGTVERRYGIVDLGTLTWTQDGTIFRTSDIKDSKRSAVANNAITTKGYESVFRITDSGDKTFILNTTAHGANSLSIRDLDYTDAASFKSAMSGVYLVYELATPTTEEAEPYTSPQIVDDWGTEEFVTTSIVPVGHNTSYPANLRDKLQHLPDLPDDDGYYMTQVTGTQMSLVRFRIPQAPAEDGEYILKATVSNGTPTYTWEAVVEAEGGEG